MPLSPHILSQMYEKKLPAGLPLLGLTFGATVTVDVAATAAGVTIVVVSSVSACFSAYYTAYKLHELG